MEEILNISFAPFYIIVDDYEYEDMLLGITGTFEVFQIDETPQ